MNNTVCSGGGDGVGGGVGGGSYASNSSSSLKIGKVVF